MISHASARHQIIGAIQSLSDRDYQRNAWLENKVPGIYENFDSIVHTLFDDTHVANKNINSVAVYFIDQKEVQVVQSVIDALDRIFTRYGFKISDAEYMALPEWNEVISSARCALPLLISNNEKLDPDDR